VKVLKIALLAAVFSVALPAKSHATYPDSCIESLKSPYDVLKRFRCYFDLAAEAWRNGWVAGAGDPDTGGY